MAVSSGTSGTTRTSYENLLDARNAYETELFKTNLERLKAGQSPAGSGGGFSIGDYQSLYSNLIDQEARNTASRMGLANFYRQAEGETAGQRDEQAFRRLSAQLANQKDMQASDIQNRQFMQTKGQELINWQRDQDFNRAFRGIRQFRGMSTGSAANFR